MVDAAFHPTQAAEVSNSRDLVVKSNLHFVAYFCYIFYLVKKGHKNMKKAFYFT